MALFSRFQEFDIFIENMKLLMPQSNKAIDVLVKEAVSFMTRLADRAMENSTKSDDAYRTYELMVSTLRCLDDRFWTVVGWKELPYLNEALHLCLESSRRKTKLKYGLSYEFNIGPRQYKELITAIRKIGMEAFSLGLRFLSHVPGLKFEAACELMAMIHDLGLMKLTRGEWQSLAVTLRRSTQEREKLLHTSCMIPPMIMRQA